MGVQVLPAYIEKYSVTLLSGTSWTVPAGCYYINVTLLSGGGGSGGIGTAAGTGTAGGATTFTGATSVSGGSGGSGKTTTSLTSAGTINGFSGEDGLGIGGKSAGRLQYAAGGAGGHTTANYQEARNGLDGQIIKSTVDTTPGASITYAIGAGGTGGTGSMLNGLDGGNGRIDIEYFI